MRKKKCIKGGKRTARKPQPIYDESIKDEFDDYEEIKLEEPTKNKVNQNSKNQNSSKTPLLTLKAPNKRERQREIEEKKIVLKRAIEEQKRMIEETRNEK